MTTKYHHPATYFISGFALALLLSAAPVRRIFGGGIPNTFVAGDVASADEVNANFEYLEARVDQIDAGLASGVSLLAMNSIGSISNPPSVTPATTGQALPLNVNVTSEGTIFLRVHSYLGPCDEDMSCELFHNGISLTQDLLGLRDGYEGISYKVMGHNSFEFSVQVTPGVHSFSFNVATHHSDPSLNMEWYYFSMSAWFIAD